MLALAFTDGLLFSGSTDTTIRLWDPQKLECLSTFSGHADRVKCLAVSSDFLFTSSDDATVGTWSFRNRCLAREGTLEGHRDVRALVVVGHHLFIGGHRTVQVWDFRTEQLLVPLCSHTETLCVLSCWHGRLFSGGIDTTVKIWRGPSPGPELAGVRPDVTRIAHHWRALSEGVARRCGP